MVVANQERSDDWILHDARIRDPVLRVADAGILKPCGVAVLLEAFGSGRRRGCHQTASNSRLGRHATGSAIQRLMSDSCQPVPLTLILIWGGNVPSAILR